MIHIRLGIRYIISIFLMIIIYSVYSIAFGVTWLFLGKDSLTGVTAYFKRTQKDAQIWTYK